MPRRPLLCLYHSPDRPPFWLPPLQLWEGGQGLGHLPFWYPQRPDAGRTDAWQIPSQDDFFHPPCPVPLQEAVDDVLTALKLDPQAVVPEVRSLKPATQALVTQGLSTRCRALLSQVPDTGAALSNEDVQGLLAVGEALIQMDAGQPSGHLLLADVLAATGVCRPSVGSVLSAQVLSRL